ncbi:uncharacterized protein LOC117644069 [Thrips palmi]|uniref:ATP-dependent DNA helicase n=1 Tax=Thrips palmi TaxID=161013 RepID=A0A6P8YQC7_THRPL|nr:uncharacterized protein LOC117644069 [Thrips palmi]
MPDGNMFPTSYLNMQHPQAVALAKASLVFIDEISMMKCWQLSVIETLCHHVTGTTRIFGGKVIVVGGDFRQTLPTCKKEEGDILSNCVFSNPLWEHFQILQLTENMRAVNDPEYTKWCLSIGDGTANVEPGFTMFPLKIGQEIVTFTKNLPSLIETVFKGDFHNHKRAIIANTNKKCCEVNDIVTCSISGQGFNYLSMSLLENVDSTENDNEYMDYTILVELYTIPVALTLYRARCTIHTFSCRVGWAK